MLELFPRKPIAELLGEVNRKEPKKEYLEVAAAAVTPYFSAEQIVVWASLRDTASNGVAKVMMIMDGCQRPLTVPILVVVTLVAQPILVSVPLGGVVNAPAVVTGVAVDVLVAVPLVHVGDKPAIVLWQTNSVRFAIRVSIENPEPLQADGPFGLTRPTSLFTMPSLSASSSQASPVPSPSASSCPELGTNTQLSWRRHSALLITPPGAKLVEISGGSSTWLQFLSVHWSISSG